MWNQKLILDVVISRMEDVLNVLMVSTLPLMV